MVVGLGAVSAIVVRQVTVGGDLTAPLIALGVLAALTPLTHWWESWVAHDMAFRLLAEMRIDVYRKLDRLAPAYLVRHRSGDIISAVTTDVETVELFFAHTIAPAFVAVAVPVSVLVVIGAIQWPLALILPALFGPCRIPSVPGARRPGRPGAGRAGAARRGERAHGRRHPGHEGDTGLRPRAGPAGRGDRRAAPLRGPPHTLFQAAHRPAGHDRGWRWAWAA